MWGEWKEVGVGVRKVRVKTYAWRAAEKCVKWFCRGYAMSRGPSGSQLKSSFGNLSWNIMYRGYYIRRL
jgi:hypothetical protein